MTPVDWELDETGLDIGGCLSLYNPDSDGHCRLNVDGEYDFNVPYQALKQFVERVEDRNLNQGFKS